MKESTIRKKDDEKNGVAENYPYEELIAELTDKMEDVLDRKRMRHTLSVAQTAACMAMCHGEDPYKAYIAGLLHDCAKCLKNKKKLELAKEFGLLVSEAAQENPDLLHAALGAELAKKEYGIEDESIISAIRWHTTGKPDMTRLEMIVYIADYIEIHRKTLPLLANARRVAFSDLEECMCVILESTLSFLGKKGAAVDPITRESYEYYKKGGRL